MITIDARGCGSGKTRGENNNPNDNRSINFKINALIEENEKVLVVLPGIELIKEYKEQFPYAKAIYSDIASNVSNELFNSIADGKRLIIITHKAFLQQKIHSGTKQHYHLIIDEAFDPWTEQTISSEKKDIIFDWEDHTVINDAYFNTDYCELEFVDLATNNITCDSNIVRDLTNSNWLNYVKWEQYLQLTSTGKKRVSVIQELNPLIISGWQSTHIAAAAFNRTFLYHWMTKHNIEFKVIYEFEKHQTPLLVYYPVLSNNKELKNSKYKKFNCPWIREQFNEFVSSVDEPVIRLKNNSDKSGVFSSETCIKHNVAGLNNLSDTRNVSLESILNASPEMAAWFKNQLMLDDIYAARTGYLYYQVLMRSCLRRNEEATIFTIDSRAILDINAYFENLDFNEFVINLPVSQQVLKEAPLTSTERSQVKRYRDKHRGHSNLSPREVLEKINQQKATKNL